MDPSVAALFDGRQSSDQEQGTDAASEAHQAELARLALQKHLDDFGYACVTATKIAIGSLAGIGQLHVTPTSLDRICKLGGTFIKIMWGACGGAKELAAVVKMAKAELLGPAEDYADKAHKWIEGHLQKEVGKTVSAADLLKSLTHACTVNATAFAERGKVGVANASVHELAQTWRQVAGVRENSRTEDGARFDQGRKETATTMELDALTGIPSGGTFAMQLAATLLQEAQAELAALAVGGTARREATQGALSYDAAGQAERTARESGDLDWVRADQDKRAQVYK
jgi:hypothetical protein